MSGSGASSAVPCRAARTPNRDALLIAVALSGVLATAASAQPPSAIVKPDTIRVIPRAVQIPREMPIFQVVSMGATPDVAQRMVDKAKLRGKSIRDQFGVLRYMDPEKFQQIPMKKAPDGSEVMDFEALKAMKVMDPKQAIIIAEAAIKETGIDVQGARFSATHSLFEMTDLQGRSVLKTPLDTQVDASFMLGNFELVGPGAKCKFVFSADGSVSQMHYAFRGLKAGPSVPILQRPEADRILIGMLKAAGNDPQGLKLSARLVYYAPPLELGTVRQIVPHWEYNGSFMVGRDRVVMRTTYVPAVQNAPRVGMVASFGDGSVRAGAKVGGGTPPYRFAWSSSSVPLEARENMQSIAYKPAMRPLGKLVRGVPSEMVGVTVTDANGLMVAASKMLALPRELKPLRPPVIPGGGIDGIKRIPEMSLATPEMDRIASVPDAERFTDLRFGASLASFLNPTTCNNDVDSTIGSTSAGAEWIGLSQGLGGSQANARGFVDRMRGAGVSIQFNFGEFSAWEKDFKDPTRSGIDSSYIDNVDVAFYTGHGNPDGFTFSSNQDTTFMNRVNARWGNRDLEWLVLATCLILNADDGIAMRHARWGPSFQGLHMLLSYDTVSGDNTSEGNLFADRITRTPSFWFDFWNNPMKIREAWISTATDTQGSSVYWAFMMPVARDGHCPWNDYYWGRGSVSGDIRPADILYFCSVRGRS